MRASRKTEQEQYELVMACRTSGLTDYQWCKENDIKPGTFYNWVSRLRKKACELPAPATKDSYQPAEEPDVVRLEIAPEPYPEMQAVSSHQVNVSEAPAPIVIQLRDASISLQNTVDPLLLDRILHLLGGSIC